MSIIGQADNITIIIIANSVSIMSMFEDGDKSVSTIPFSVMEIIITLFSLLIVAFVLLSLTILTIQALVLLPLLILTKDITLLSLLVKS